jgi:MFS transporter, DHA2 family, multidrug resistance protein
MQSAYGAVLAAGFATTMAAAVATSPEAAQASASVQRTLQLSYASALTVAGRYPEYATSIQEAARAALLDGGHLAHGIGLLLVLGGALVVALGYPGRDRERAMLAAYHAEDAAAGDAATERAATLSSGGTTGRGEAGDPTAGDLP